MADTLIAELLQLAKSLEAAWPNRLDALRASGVPLNAGDGDDGDGAGDDAGGDDDSGTGAAGDDDAGKGSGSGSGETDWKAMARKHEREAKKQRKAAEDAAAKLAARDAENQTEHEKAIEAARKEGRDEALTEHEKERRADRLEVSVTRLAARGVKVGQGEDAKTVRFADTEDALINLERAISKGDVDADDIFDSDGKVQTDALHSALGDLLERKPHLAAGEGTKDRPAGDADAGKGSGAKSPDDMSVEEHHKAIRRHKP